MNEVAKTNVHMTLDNIRKDSPVLKDMEDAGEIALVGAMYDISNGEVHFY